MFVKIETEGPDGYGVWKATASHDLVKAVGIADTEEDSVEDAKRMLAIMLNVSIDEVIQDVGIIRK